MHRFHRALLIFRRVDLIEEQIDQLERDLRGFACLKTSKTD